MSSRSKYPCRVYLIDLHGGKKAFYGMSKLIFLQKLSHFQVPDFDRTSYGKNGQNLYFEVLYAKRISNFNFPLLRGFTVF